VALRHWYIIIAPLHMVYIDAEEMQQHGEVLTFVAGKESASVLSLVPKSPPTGESA
jgi:hypothetical protein